jgi:HPt (histidine-containing phosphotransfer) domain-containing protein
MSNETTTFEPSKTAISNLYDLTKLRELCNHDEAVVQKLIGTFLATTPHLFQDIRKGIALQNAQLIYDANHQMKVSLSFLDAQTALELSCAIEEEIKYASETYDLLAAKANQLETVLQQIYGQLNH